MMSKWSEQSLKRIANANVLQSAIPIYLYTCNGKLFYAHGDVNNHVFKSPFFIVESVDEKNHSAILHILLPYPLFVLENDRIHSLQKFLRTGKFIKVDLHCFFGFSHIPIPVYDGIIVADLIKDTICIPYAMRKKDTPIILWMTNEKNVMNSATISLDITTKSEGELMLNIFTKEGGVISKASAGESKSITVSNITQIELETTMESVTGTLEIQLNRKQERKITFV
jgi:hypothetical protein